MDRVTRFRLRERELLLHSAEGVAPVADAVRPREQYLTPARPAHLALVVAVEHLTVAVEKTAQPSAHLDDPRFPPAMGDLELTTARPHHGSRKSRATQSSASTAMTTSLPTHHWQIAWIRASCAQSR